MADYGMCPHGYYFEKDCVYCIRDIVDTRVRLHDSQVSTMWNRLMNELAVRLELEPALIAKIARRNES